MVVRSDDDKMRGVSDLRSRTFWVCRGGQMVDGSGGVGDIFSLNIEGRLQKDRSCKPLFSVTLPLGGPHLLFLSFFIYRTSSPSGDDDLDRKQ